LRKHAFNRKITLLSFEPQSGFNKPRETARETVWANVSDVGATTKFAALQTGLVVSLTVLMWRNEFHGYTHCEIDGERFKIVQTGSAGNDLHIKLLLERG